MSTGRGAGYQACDIHLIADTDCPQLRSASERICVFHAHTTVSATEVSLLPVLVCGTLCRHICDRTWNYRHFKQSLKGHMFRL